VIEANANCERTFFPIFIKSYCYLHGMLKNASNQLHWLLEYLLFQNNSWHLWIF